MRGTITSPVDGAGRTRNCRGTTVPGAWLRLPTTPASPRPQAAWLEDAETPVTTPAGPVLAVLSDAIPSIAKTISAAIQAGLRVYLLTPNKASLPREWLAAAPTSLLVRHLANPPAGLVLAGGSGWLWAGPTGPGPWRAALDADQCEAARRAFLTLFWDHATEETWPSAKGWTWHEPGAPPFDLHPATGVVRLEPGRGAPPDGPVVYRPDGRLPDGPAERVWVPPTPSFEAQLDRQARGTQVTWRDLGLPPCTPAEIMAASNEWTLRLRTTNQQSKAVTGLLKGPAQFELVGPTTLGELEERVGHAGGVQLAGKAFAPLVPSRTISLGITQAPSLRAVPQAAPSKYPEPEPLALAVAWSWQVAVPGLPSGHTDDPLVKAWQAVDADHARRVEEIRKQLKSLADREGALGRTWERLKGAVLGFGRKRAGLEQAVQALAATVPSEQGPVGARAVLGKLAELEAEVGRLATHLVEAERREREDDERRKQQQAWEEGQAAARRKLAAAEAAQQEAQVSLARLEAELGALASDAGLDPKDLKVAQKRLRDDSKKAEQRAQRAAQAAAAAREILNGSFVFRPSVQPAGGKGAASFVPPPPRGTQSVPDDALPRVGRLRVRGKERFLAIAAWEDLEPGEAEAARLKATLVADLETP